MHAYTVYTLYSQDLNVYIKNKQRWPTKKWMSERNRTKKKSREEMGENKNNKLGVDCEWLWWWWHSKIKRTHTHQQYNDKWYGRIYRHFRYGIGPPHIKVHHSSTHTHQLKLALFQFYFSAFGRFHFYSFNGKLSSIHLFFSSHPLVLHQRGCLCAFSECEWEKFS